MGRIKTTQIKRITHKLMALHRDKFKKDFNDNKKIVDDLLEVRSKKLRNVIAGYVTRLVKVGKKWFFLLDYCLKSAENYLNKRLLDAVKWLVIEYYYDSSVFRKYKSN